MPHLPIADFDVAIIGAGPAGLSAAITLSRACRNVVVFDHGQPRNFAAKAVHCYLGLDGLSPWQVREKGREEATLYGATFFDEEVTEAKCLTKSGSQLSAFSLKTSAREVRSRGLLFATGVMDKLPDVPGLQEAYGRLVHHCPFCDGFEHRNQSLIALGSAASAPKLGSELLGWSKHITVCTNGERLSEQDRLKLEHFRIAVIEEPISRFDGTTTTLVFRNGQRIACEGLFFSSGQAQASELPKMVGCEFDDEGHIVTKKKQCSNVPGVYLAGDADGDVQFAVVAAAEGAIAATAIHRDLLQQDQEF